MKKDFNLVQQLKDFENKWVALTKDEMKVVASADSYTEAKKQAQEKGFKNTIFYKVRPFNKGYVYSRS